MHRSTRRIVPLAIAGGLLLVAATNATAQSRDPRPESADADTLEASADTANRARASRRSAADTILPVISLEELVVTATRTEEALINLPANVTVLTERDVQLSATRTVDEFLRQIPGFNLLRPSNSIDAHPGAQGVNMRGLGATAASRTLVLVDGVPLNDPFSGWVRWSSVPLGSVQRIETVRGGGSGVWGNRALGGVINIITHPPDGREAAVTAEGGSYSTVRAYGSGSYDAGDVSFRLSGSYFDTEGYPVVPEDIRGPIDGTATLEYVTLSAETEYAVSPALTIDVGGRFYHDDRNSGTPFRFNSSDVGFVRAGADLTTPDGSQWLFRVFGSGQTYRNTFGSASEDRTVETPTIDQFDVPATSIGGTLHWTKPAFANQVLLAGVDLQWIDGEANEDSRFRDGVFTRRRVTGGQQLLGGAYLQDVVSLGERWQLLGSARLNVWRNYAGFRTQTSLEDGAELVDERFDDRTESNLTYSLGVRYRAGSVVSLWSSLYSGFRAPTLNELHKPFRASGGRVVEVNPNLGPEDLVGAEVGADLQFATGVVGRFTAFWNRLDNAILEATIEEAGPEGRTIDPCGFVPAGGVCQRMENVGDFRSLGIEAELETRPHPFWLFSARYLFNPTKMLSAPQRPDVVGKRMARSPENQVVVQAAYGNAALVEASLLARYVGAQFEDDRNDLELSDFVVFNANVSRPIFDNLEAFLGVQNIFDAEYQVARARDGFMRTGAPRLVTGGVRLRV